MHEAVRTRELIYAQSRKVVLNGVGSWMAEDKNSKTASDKRMNAGGIKILSATR